MRFCPFGGCEGVDYINIYNLSTPSHPPKGENFQQWRFSLFINPMVLYEHIEIRKARQPGGQFRGGGDMDMSHMDTIEQCQLRGRLHGEFSARAEFQPG